MRRALCYLFLLALQACASMDGVTPTPSANYIAPETDQWAVNGKFSFRGPEGRESGQFYWTQEADNYHLRLLGPLGVGGAEVERHDQGVTIRANGNTYQGENTAELLYQLTGIWIPVSDLSELLLGRFTPRNTLWEVQYQGVLEVNNYRLPEQLRLSTGDAELQIFVSRWTL